MWNYCHVCILTDISIYLRSFLNSVFLFNEFVLSGFEFLLWWMHACIYDLLVDNKSTAMFTLSGNEVKIICYPLMLLHALSSNFHWLPKESFVTPTLCLFPIILI